MKRKNLERIAAKSYEDPKPNARKQANPFSIQYLPKLSMLNFQYSSLINAPVERVWQFHERTDVLELLTPPWQPVTIVRRQGGLGVGAVSEFKLSLAGIPVPWIATHIECVPNRLFVDRQTEGPMESWTHRHEFSPEGSQTRLTDAIAYEIPGGFLSEMLLGWWVEARLQDMFRYRHQVTKTYCE